MRVYSTTGSSWLLSGTQAAAGLLCTSLIVLGCASGAASLPSASSDLVVGLPYQTGVQPLKESYAGHITVRNWTPKGQAKDSGTANLFYWYFPAIAPKTANPPLLLWMQGGPGSTSMIGLFTENGPLELTNDGKFTRRNVTWANEYDIVYVDQPAGTGFSYVHPKADLTLKKRGSRKKSSASIKDIAAEADTAKKAVLDPNYRWPKYIQPFLSKLVHTLDARQSKALISYRPRSDKSRYSAVSTDPYLVNSGYDPSSAKNATVWEKIGLSVDESEDYKSGYVANMRAVAKDMWSFLQKFFDIHPHLRTRDFYITSESYGGRFTPAIATYITQQNDKLGKSDPKFINLKGISVENSFVHPPLQLMAHATIAFDWGLLDADQADIVDFLAFKAVNHTLYGDLNLGTHTRLMLLDYFKNVTGNINTFDIRQRNHQYRRKFLSEGLNQPAVREALHSKDTPFEDDAAVKHYLAADNMRTTAPLYSYLLERYPVQLGQGNFDFRDGVTSNTWWINELEWSGKSKFASAKRQQLKIGNELLGYYTSGGQLTHAVILDAGHMSSGDKPEACLEMLHRLVLPQ
ncbi:hypothetical protein GGI12_003903 [Dipsacomyces acuminosporus]|nr:hypothetical protein GGI12_003903 [Dipsacomyces acuminosporus]